MKRIIILICLVFTNLCVSQETKEVKNTIGEKEEVFSVLKSKTEIKHGKYLLTWNWKYYNSISEEGNYKNNEKQGVWLEYYRFRNKYDKNDMRVKYLTTYENNQKNGIFVEFGYDKDTLQVGSFFKNIKTGIWKRFENGKLVEHYDYSNEKNLIEIDNNQNEKVDVLPKIIDGDLNTFLIKNLNPVNYKKKKDLFGSIEVIILIKKDGLVQVIDITGTEYEELKNEFSLALSQSSGKWEPAIRNKEKVDLKVLIPIKFLIEWKKNTHRVGMNCGIMKQIK
ncbi:hypothetical protein ACNQGO_15310 [Flavobacterium sp. ZT3P35]|uniref:hypothetical protein n=1 Tax=Flavobacterium sp. ZT3P35 TaxID=3401727 RepID=UPI003AAA36C3